MDTMAPVQVVSRAEERKLMDDLFATVRFAGVEDLPHGRHGLPVVDDEPGQDEAPGQLRASFADLASLELTRYVRTPAGERRFGLPIGSPIGEGGKTLSALKADAEKLGPHSKAAADYKARLAKAPAKPVAPSVPNSPLEQLRREAERKGPHSKAALLYREALAKQAAPETKPAAAAPKVSPVIGKAGPVSDGHKATSLDGLTKAEVRSLTLYTGESYRGINGGLRKRPPGVKYRKAVDNIDAALARKPLAEPTKVWRSIGGNAFGIPVDGSAATLKGRTFTEAGFMSTAVVNSPFSVDPPPIHMTMEVPPGVGAIYVEPITKNTNEKELLLQRDLRYVITKIRFNTDRERWEATARILPPGSVAA